MIGSVAIFATVLAGLGAAGIFFLKRAGDALKSDITQFSDFYKLCVNLISNVDLWFGTGFYLLAFLWMMMIIARAPLSLFYPLAVGINIVLTCMVGVFLLDEAMSAGKAAGIFLILSGVVVASINQ